jgi:chorismate mutase/ribosomal protein S18 acetylase RimI-like enzyme
VTSTDADPHEEGPDEAGPDLLIRPANDEDAEPLADLFVAAREAAYPAMPHPVHPPHEVRHWFREVLGLEERTVPMPEEREVWVAEADGVVVGYAIVDPGWLDSLYVRPDLTGRGIGATLLELVKGLRPDGFGLWVFASNVAAQRFYRRHGLVPVRRTDGSENEEGAPDVEMLWPGRDPLGTVRRRIDAVDDRLADLLDERALLTAAAQRLKHVGGHAGRDPDREAQIAARMAQRAPDLGEAALTRIMQAVIEAGLDAVRERERGPDAPS